MNASYCALCVISLSRIPGEARRCCFRRMAVEANSQQCERRTCYESCMFQKRWIVRPMVRNLLLISEDEHIPALALLAQRAIEQDLAVTVIQQCENAASVYPPALLPAEVEYLVVTRDGSVGLPGELTNIVANYLGWADAACCSVSHQTAIALYRAHERLRLKHFAQAVVLQPLVCGNGACLTCQLDTHHGPKLVCRDGPVFNLRDIV